MHTPDYDHILRLAIRACPIGARGIHGVSHWLRVERIGLAIAERSGADLTVVRLFARLHDCRRENDDHDPHHGHRAAEFAATLRPDPVRITDAQCALLVEALRGHDRGRVSTDPTIGTCWDADRLDLGRVGIAPHARFLSTAAAKDEVFRCWAEGLWLAEDDVA